MRWRGWKWVREVAYLQNYKINITHRLLSNQRVWTRERVCANNFCVYLDIQIHGIIAYWIERSRDQISARARVCVWITGRHLPTREITHMRSFSCVSANFSHVRACVDVRNLDLHLRPRMLMKYKAKLMRLYSRVRKSWWLQVIQYIFIGPHRRRLHNLMALRNLIEKHLCVCSRWTRLSLMQILVWCLLTTRLFSKRKY